MTDTMPRVSVKHGVGTRTYYQPNCHAWFYDEGEPAARDLWPVLDAAWAARASEERSWQQRHAYHRTAMQAQRDALAARLAADAVTDTLMRVRDVCASPALTASEAVRSIDSIVRTALAVDRNRGGDRPPRTAAEEAR